MAASNKLIHLWIQLLFAYIWLLTGPETWHELFPIANGERQSPIDIITDAATYDPNLPPFNVDYDPTSAKVIMNSGHTFSVEFDDDKDKSVVRGGPLHGSYRLRQIHFHWGRTDECGSEHKVDGKDYPAELHIVHWNAEKYSSFLEAANKPDGLAVLGIFLKIEEHNKNLEKISNALDDINFKVPVVKLDDINERKLSIDYPNINEQLMDDYSFYQDEQSSFTDFDPSCLLPDCKEFWTYQGSITVPPLLESVTWIVLKEPITVSSRQLLRFRSLFLTTESDRIEPCCMETNHRPIQPLKGRKVRASFL